ncbi:CaiB/BaiF CoA transferase family protein [Futiania mangrovi]|uniref:CoA transferase n=1 Tax=Futiania mangrovi TaxID=2959716 RepID=A0A9J6PET2_9PROT|nr:CoA transferase [Futiania mangrovii]MCP1336291.1 CoA transferase [Futiania mangrovii]
MSADPVAEGPLAGIRVLDLTAIVLGPLATLCLADMGADVVKVEPPEGDAIRNGGAARHAGMGAIYLALNRNKRSLALDLKRPEAREILARLAQWADVVVHNMRPEAARRLGIDAETLCAQNPRLIHCSASGFAAGTAREKDPAVDDVIQAASGVAALFAGEGQEPRYVPGLIADKVAGLLLTQAILGALLARTRTGRGQAVSLPMFEALATFTLIEQLGGDAFLPRAGAPGYARLKTPYRRPMRTADGYIAITPYSQRNWQDFFRAAGRPDLAGDPRVTDTARRNAEVGDLYALLAEMLPARRTAHWMEIARQTGIPAAPVRSVEDLIASGDLEALGYVVELDHPTEGRTRAPGPIVRLEGVSTAHARPAPWLGQDGASVLTGLGFEDDEVRTWRDAGVLVERRPGGA